MFFLACDNTHFGDGCIQVCTCQNGATCDGTTGMCTCPPGFMNANCSEGMVTDIHVHARFLKNQLRQFTLQHAQMVSMVIANRLVLVRMVQIVTKRMALALASQASWATIARIVRMFNWICMVF